MKGAISNRSPPVAVEYDFCGARRVKEFASAFEARRFFMVKDRDGKNPKVRSIEMARRSRSQKVEENPVEENEVEETEVEYAVYTVADAVAVDPKIEAEMERLIEVGAKASRALKAAAECFQILGLEGTEKQLSKAAEKVTVTAERVAKRVARSVGKEEREKAKVERAAGRKAKKQERIIKLKEQLEKLLAAESKEG